MARHGEHPPRRSPEQEREPAAADAGSGERPTEARIDLDALRHNAALARRLAGGREVVAVVKADAYGHGAVPCARALAATGCTRLAVLTVAEAVPLREAGLALPILILGGLHDPEEAARARQLALTPVLHDDCDVALAQGASGPGRPWPVQVEVDTGMRRRGVPSGEALELLDRVARGAAGLALEGVFTHLARADEADLAPSLHQLEVFRGVVDALRARGVAPGQVHAQNSAGLLSGAELSRALPEATAVRPGLLLYGVSPAPHFAESDALRPVMSLVTRVAQVRTVSPGEGVGYGATWRASAPSRVATLPVGYADGVAWAGAAGGAMRVWLAGALRPVVGRVSMDYLAVDEGEAAVERGDPALVFGRLGEALHRVEHAARDAGTLSYELLVRVGPRVPRRLV